MIWLSLLLTYVFLHPVICARLRVGLRKEVLPPVVHAYPGCGTAAGAWRQSLCTVSHPGCSTEAIGVWFIVLGVPGDSQGGLGGGCVSRGPLSHFSPLEAADDQSIFVSLGC